MRGLLLVLAACGGDGAASGFIGTWTYASGMQTIDCDRDELDETITPMGSFDLRAGSSADLETEADAPCPAISFDVSGTMATARPGQGCSETDQGITRATLYDAYTFRLDGESLIETITGSFTVSGGISTSCTLARTAISTQM